MHLKAKAIIVFVIVTCSIVVYFTNGRFSGARLAIPDELIIPEAEAWVYISSPFSLTNPGTEQLEITAIESGCSCLGIEMDREGRRYRIDSLKIPPKSAMPVFVCLQQRVNDGESTGVVVRFHSNDASKPVQDLKVIVSKVTGGVFAEPTVLQFGKIPIGTTEYRDLQITDRSLNPRIIQQLALSSNLFVLDKLEAKHIDIFDQYKKRVATLIGKATIGLRADSPGSYAESIQVHLKDANRPPLTISVYATVVDVVEAIPKRLVLPRRTDEGDSYSSEVRVCVTAQIPISSFQIDPCSFANVNAFQAPDRPSELRLAVSVDHSKYVVGNTIIGRIVVNGKTHEFKIPVLILGGK